MIKPFLEREEATTTSQLVGILPGDPPKVNLVDYATGRNGSKRHFTRQVPVPDKDLFEQLQREVNVGDHIRATVVNEYRETGSVVYLAGFNKMMDIDQVTATKNGTTKIVQNDITQIILPPVRDSKTEVRR